MDFTLRTIMISNAWQQNPNHNEFQINSFSSIETLRSAVYHFILSVSSSGIKVVLKREMNKVCINNFNHIWLLVWNGNMDIQPIFDYFSVIIYVTDYVAKVEKQTSEILKAVKKPVSYTHLTLPTICSV